MYGRPAKSGGYPTVIFYIVYRGMALKTLRVLKIEICSPERDPELGPIFEKALGVKNLRRKMGDVIMDGV